VAFTLNAVKALAADLTRDVNQLVIQRLADPTHPTPPRVSRCAWGLGMYQTPSLCWTSRTDSGGKHVKSRRCRSKFDGVENV
jgi:hypothetical protein